jgi:hypothetical protein
MNIENGELNGRLNKRSHELCTIIYYLKFIYFIYLVVYSRDDYYIVLKGEKM